MSAWYLLWMFFDVVGILGLLLVGIPLAALRIVESEDRTHSRQHIWWAERRRRRETELYGQLLAPCLYCGSQCEFGPGCFNRHLSPAARARRNEECLHSEMPHLRDRAAKAMASLAPKAESFPQLPCPCARCGKSATLFRAFQNTAGHVFCSESCYRAGGEA